MENVKGVWLNLLDFEYELSKYEPINGIDDVENSVESDELRDIMDFLNYICININKE